MFRLITLLAASLFSLCSFAAPFPERPVQVIVPFAAGGGADVVMRALAPAFGEALGQPVIIDNRVGAGGNIGTQSAARSPADGYTLLLATAAQTINNALAKGLTWDLRKDFAPITMVVRNQHLVVVHPSLPVTNIRELIELAKARPGQITYASYGNGSTAHMATELFKNMTGVDMLHVPYKGAAPAVNAVIAGEVDVLFGDMAALLPFVKAGRVRAIAFGSAKRFPGLPEVPTVGETVPGFESGGFLALLAPAGTPQPVIDTLNKAMVKALNSPGMREKLEAQGGLPEPGTPDQLAQILRADIEQWNRVIKAAGIRAE